MPGRDSRISTLDSRTSNPESASVFNREPRAAPGCGGLLRRAGVDSNSGPLVALNAGATNSRAKRWPEDRFAALADRLMESLGSRVVFIGAASERDAAGRIIRQMKRARRGQSRGRH